MRTFALGVALLAAVVLVAPASADEDDPEPPRGPASLRKLQGKWTSVGRISEDTERPYPGLSYTFEGSRVTYALSKGDKGTTRKMTAKVDPKRPGVIEMTPDTKKGGRYFFKIDNERLYLLPCRDDDPKAKPDFAGGMMGSVLVLEKQK